MRELLGEMAAAGALMQANIKFNGALVLQIFGDGPVKLAVAEVQPDLSLRVTAKVVGEVPPMRACADHGQRARQGPLRDHARPARTSCPGQQPYQGVVPLHGDQREPLQQLSTCCEHYMLQSEQLDTALVLAADDKVAAGLLIQRLPVEGEGNLAGRWRRRTRTRSASTRTTTASRILAATLTREELLTLDADTILRRLFWEEKLLRFEPQRRRASPAPAAASAWRSMIRGLGREEADSILAERGEIEVGCDFCGQQYRFDAVDVGADVHVAAATSRR